MLLSASSTGPSVDNSPAAFTPIHQCINLDQKLLQAKLSSQFIDSARSPFSPQILSPKESADLTVVSSFRESAMSFKAPFSSIKINPREGDQEIATQEATEPDRPRRNKKLPSILRKSRDENEDQQESEDSLPRVDKDGILIVRGGKSHSVGFKQKIHSVNLVESWKEHNKEDQKVHCNCNVF